MQGDRGGVDSAQVARSVFILVLPEELTECTPYAAVPPGEKPHVFSVVWGLLVALFQSVKLCVSRTLILDDSFLFWFCFFVVLICCRISLSFKSNIKKRKGF